MFLPSTVKKVNPVILFVQGFKELLYFSRFLTTILDLEESFER